MILSYFDLKGNLNYAIQMKTRRKMIIFSEFLLTFFSFFWGRNSKKAKHREILHFEKHSSLRNWFGKRNMFLVFWGWNFKEAAYREILHFEKHSSLRNQFEKKTMFLVFEFFHILCRFRISTSPLSVTKNEKKIINISF